MICCVGLNEGDGGAGESGPGHPGPKAAIEFAGKANGDVRCGTGHLEEVMKRFMACVHQLAQPDGVAASSARRSTERALVLGNHVHRSPPIGRIEIDALKVGEGHITQGRRGERRCHSLAGSAAGGVLAVDQPAAGPRIEDNDANGVGEW